MTVPVGTVTVPVGTMTVPTETMLNQFKIHSNLFGIYAESDVNYQKSCQMLSKFYRKLDQTLFKSATFIRNLFKTCLKCVQFQFHIHSKSTENEFRSYSKL